MSWTNDTTINAIDYRVEEDDYGTCKVFKRQHNAYVYAFAIRRDRKMSEEEIERAIREQELDDAQYTQDLYDARGE